MKRITNFLVLLIFILSLSFVLSCKKTNVFTVRFNTLGGSICNDVTVDEGNTISQPEDPTYGLNSFMGWYTDVSYIDSFDFNTSINSDITLYAKWRRVLNVYTVNDFHGAIEEQAAKVGDYIISNTSENQENSIVLSAGDMFQGSGISNYNYGLDMVNIMNMIGFDAMSVGNHEFDWELNTILNYFDGNIDNGEANFPLLGCNVIDKTTNQLPENMQAYHIIEKSGLKIGVIGYIGATLENSIATDMVENYEFVDPVSIISEISNNLRTKNNVDVVIALGHDASSTTNNQIANLSDDSKVDAIVNGHTHVRSNGTIRRSSDNVRVPYVQAGSSGEAVGCIKLELEPLTNKVLTGSASTKLITASQKENVEINNYIDELIAETSHYFDKVIGVAGKKMSVYNASEWAANAILDYCKSTYQNCDIAFLNIGGIREGAFPIDENEEITIKRIFTMMPFDNTINLTTISGKILRLLITNKGELEYSSDSVSIDGSTVYINGVLLNDDSYYRCAVVDYIFDKTTYPFNKGEDIYFTGVLLRDILIENIENDTASGNKCFLGKE